MTTMEAQEAPEMTTAQVVETSVPGMLMKKVNTAIKANPAMPVGIFWKQHLQPMLEAMLVFSVEYAEDAAEDAAADVESPEGADAIIDGLTELAVEGKEVIEGSIGLLSETFELLKLLDEQGVPLAEKMPEKLKGLFLAHQPKLEAWTLKFPQLIEVEPEAPQAAPQVVS